MSFEALPNEIVAEIGHFLDYGKDMKNLRLANRNANAIIERILWNTRALVVNLNRLDLRSEMEKLETLASGSKASEYIRSIRIKSLDPDRPLEWTEERQWDDDEEDDLELYEEDIRAVAGPEPEDVADAILEALKMLPDVIARAFSSFKGLCYASIRIPPSNGLMVLENHQYIEQFYRPALRSLSTLPVLNNLVLIGGTCFHDPLLPVPSLEGFKHLQSLVITGLWDPMSRRDLLALGKTIRQNRNLTRLKLSSHFDTSFDDLFEEEPGETKLPPLKLHDLHLNGWEMTPTPSVLRHLECLHSLELPNLCTELYSSIWHPLRSSSVHLRHISVYGINADFLDYMESYTGLEILKISIAGLGFDETDHLARRFYGKSLPTHKESIRTLQMGTVAEDEWTVGLKTVNVFDQYNMLTCLAVGLKATDINPGKGIEGDIVTALVSRLTHLPELNLVTMLSPPPRNEEISDPSETSVARSLERIRVKTVRCLEAMRLPKSSIPSPIPPFLVSTLTPNCHYLTESEEDKSVLVFVRENNADGDDSHYFTSLEDAGTGTILD